MIGRRSIVQLLLGAPLAGRAVAEHALAGGGDSMPPIAPSMFGGLESVTQPAPPAQKLTPRMAHADAIRMIFNDAKALEEIRDELFAAELRNGNPYIDADIQVMKSFSPMAKIAFQRQRNVERALADVLDPSYDRPNRFIRAIESRLKKVMWG